MNLLKKSPCIVRSMNLDACSCVIAKRRTRFQTHLLAIIDIKPGPGGKKCSLHACVEVYIGYIVKLKKNDNENFV